MKKIIFYGLDDNRKERMSNLFGDKFVLKFIDKVFLNQNVGNIFDDKEEDLTQEVQEDKVFENEFMLIQGFEDDEDLKELLFVFKNNLVARPITSMRTPNNEKWTLKELLKELFEENEYMKNYNK